MGDANFHNLAINTLNCKAKDIYEEIFILPKERRGFAYNKQIMMTPVFFYRIIGVEEEAAYEEKILDLHEKLMSLDKLYQKHDKSLDRFIPNDFIQRVNQYWNQVGRINDPTAEAIVSLTMKPGILTSMSPVKNKLIQDKLVLLLDVFMASQKNINIVKNFYIKLLFWIERYAVPLLTAYQYGGVNPKVLFYGEIQRDEAYFLLLLSFMGFDVLYFNSFDGGRFEEIPRIDIYSNLLEYPQRIPIKSFPTIPTQKRQETVAYRASVEIDQVLHTEDSGVYRPWQFEDYELKVNSLKTTYDELFILWKEDARFREGFKVDQGRVYVPNIFAKVSGTLTDLNQYWQQFNSLIISKETTLLIEEIPFTIERNYLINRSVFNIDGSLNLDKVRQLKEYRFHYLKTSVQNLILDKMNELIVTEDLFTFPLTAELKTKILYTILSLEKRYLDLIQRFDYPYGLPKLIIYDRDERTFSKEDLIILAFLHFVGFDIVIFTPTGYNNIENGINRAYYDIHRLEELRFNLNVAQQPQENRNPIKKGLFWFLQS